MSSEYIARPLTKSQVLQAFPLIQALDKRLTPQAWRQFAEATFAGAGGEDRGHVITLQTATGYIHALFVYWVREDLCDGRRMDVDHVVTFELPGQVKALRATLRVIEQMARESGCDMVNVAIPRQALPSWPDQSVLTSTFGDNGYSATTLNWCKTVRDAVARR